MTAVLPRIVYLIDDDDAVRDSLRALLETYDLAVEDYPSATAFLAEPRDLESACLVVDIHMPVMSGTELLEVLLQREQRPIAIAITGAGDAALRERLKHLGVRAMLDKPIHDDALMQTIERAFEG